MSESAARTLTGRELRRIERWARGNKKPELLDFLAELPRHIVIPRRTLMGSWQGHDRFVEGFSNSATLIREIYFMDDTYNPNPFADDLTLHLRKRLNRPDGDFWRARSLGLGTKTDRVCLAAHLGGCSDHIISAHSIQRSELARLARADNHVYGFVLGGKTDHRNFGLPEPVGINVATTFTGVCNRHDTELFRPIENKPFGGTRRELFLYHYRALLFGHYLRTYLIKKLERIHEELSVAGHEETFQEMDIWIQANRIDQPEVAEVKEECDSAHVSSSQEKMLLAAWRAEVPPPVAGTLTFAPLKDFRGKRLQSPLGNSRLEWATLTVTPKDGHTIVVIGANTPNLSATRLVESFHSIPETERMQSLIAYCLCFMDPFVILPHFWEKLDAHRKEAVIRTHHARYYPRRLPQLSSDPLISVPIIY